MSPCPQPEACRTLAPERDKPAKHCSIQLPDGTACVVLVRAGLSIKDVLAGLQKYKRLSAMWGACSRGGGWGRMEANMWVSF